MGHYYRFKRGDGVTIISDRYKGIKGVVDSAVFQRTVDYPDDAGPWLPCNPRRQVGDYGAVGQVVN